MSGNTLTTVYTESSMLSSKSSGRTNEDMLWVLQVGLVLVCLKYSSIGLKCHRSLSSSLTIPF